MKKISTQQIRNLLYGAEFDSFDGQKAIGLIINKLDELDNKCTHNVMVANNDPEFAWKCADCGHVYGKITIK